MRGKDELVGEPGHMAPVVERSGRQHHHNKLVLSLDMSETSSSNDLKKILKLMHKREHEHVVEMEELRATSVGTMRFQGSLQGMTIQILLHNGSSDNFLQPRIAHCLKLPVEDMSSLQVMVRNGNVMSTKTVIKEVQVKVQGHTLKLPVYLLPVSGVDLILGVAWYWTKN
ncbi:hypothetical protein V8G54_004341 [Vigna mungo]|uniref:Uncharacterized protein n=1 Tax=Vigna mungo TaxID=3915 RepID=A0AAQ3PDM7_VIGMU